MNSSGRAVLISVVGIVAAIGLMVGAGSGIVGRVGDGVRWLERSVPERRAERTTQDERITVDLVDFNSIYAAGGWSVTITQGEAFNVEVSASEKALEQVNVFNRGGTLHLELDFGIRSIAGNLKATVSLPDLESLQTAGGAGVTISGFDLDSLHIEVDGAANIAVHDGRIDDLSIDSDGAAIFDFSGVQVRNAEVEMDGASHLNISMAGGVLQGVLRGLGDVIFSGEVSDESIRIEGLGRIRRQ